MPQPIAYNSGAPVSGSIQDSNLSYSVEGTGRDYRGGYGGLSWMSSIPTNGNSVFIKNTTDLGRGPAGAPLFWVTTTNSELDILDIANLIPGSPRNFTTSGSAYSWALQNGYFVISEPYDQIDADGLVFYIDAGKVGSYPRADTDVYDVQGDLRTGKLRNGITWNSNGWFDFDGADDDIEFGATNTLYAGNGNVSWEVLFYADSTTGYRCLFGNASTGPPYVALHLSIGTMGLRWEVSVTAGSYVDAVLATATINRWQHFVVTYDGSIFRTYLNGVATGTIGWTQGLGNNTQTFYIGRFWAGVFNGFINNVKLYQKTLSVSEAKQNYFNGPIVTDGLIYALDAGNLVSYPRTGTTAYSLTGSVTSTLTNGTSYGSLNGGYFDFDGTNDYISIGTLSYSNNITVEAWVNTTNPIGWDDIISGGCGDLLFGINSIGNGTVTWGGQCNIPVSPITSTTSISDGNWHHVVGTYNGSTLALYIDGRLESSAARSGNFTPGTIAVGSAGGGTEFFKGKIAVARIYNRALSITEVQQNYDAQQ